MVLKTRVIRRAGWVGFVAGILLLAYLPALAAGAPITGSPSHTTPVGPSREIVITPCTFSTFQSDVLAGGTVEFGGACSLTMTSSITIPPSLSVTITSGGYAVSLSGGYSNQLFIVTGGHLNITDITLTAGRVTGIAGVAGGAGAPGSTGSNGVSGTTGGSGTGNPGGPGGAGTSGGAGGNGLNGGAGGNANGGAIMIASGWVNLVGDTLSSSAATEQHARPGRIAS